MDLNFDDPVFQQWIRSTFDRNLESVHSGTRPQDHLHDDENRSMEFLLDLRTLREEKAKLLQQRSIPPAYLKADLKTFDLSRLGMEFDVIYIDPPLDLYCMDGQSPYPAHIDPFWNWDQIKALNVSSIGANPSLVFLWAGVGEGLERGRECLEQWGYKRIEEIVWLMTDVEKKYKPIPGAAVKRTKLHCLVGMKGTLRRDIHSHIIHSNIEVDVLVGEQTPFYGMSKPKEIYELIERFCLGRRRLDLFGCDETIRPGWLTVGMDISFTSNHQRYAEHFKTMDDLLVGTNAMIDRIRARRFYKP